MQRPIVTKHVERMPYVPRYDGSERQGAVWLTGSSPNGANMLDQSIKHP